MPYNAGFDMRERIRINRATFEELADGYRFLFPDIDDLLQKPNGRFADEIKLRIKEEKSRANAKIEAEQRAVVAEKEVAVAVAQKKLADVFAPDHIASAGKVIRMTDTSLTAELEQELRKAINPLYEDVRGTESYERKRLLGEIDRLRAALAEAGRWIGDGEFSDGLNRDYWTPEYRCAVAMVEAALAHND